ncbi:MAG: hypothetical protein NT154_15710 [Verrucomicrobia bacterium]|nr:hypothetical protein [Verrucomicrobiota bacterium]
MQTGSSEFQVAASLEDLTGLASGDLEKTLQSCLLADFPGRERRHEIEREMADGIWNGVQSEPDPATLYDRYAQAILKTLALPADAIRLLPPNQDRGGVALLQDTYHVIKRTDEAWQKISSFRTEVQPLPGFDPAVLPMQQALDEVAPTPGGADYQRRMAPVTKLVNEARAAFASGHRNPKLELAAGEAIEQFRAEPIRGVGPVAFIRHPSFDRINAPDPYNWPFRGPASIAVFDPAQPERPPRTVYDDPGGSVFNMSLSFDARTLFFSARRPGVPEGWQIYEIGVDGSGLRQITRETRPDSGQPLSYGGFHHPDPNIDNNISPVELPSGELMFVSSRAGNVLVCQPGRAAVLYVCNRDGSHVRRVSANTLSDHTPAVMDDGRVMFTRWDYGVDKGVFERQGVWTVNPDGSRLQLFFGNTILDPNAFWQCVPVPGRPEVLSSFGGHHAGPYGVVGVLWNRLGVEAGRGEGYRFLTPEYPTYYDGNFSFGYMDPHPLNEHEFLVSYGGDGQRRSRLYLMDDCGNRTCIWEEAELGCYCPIPLRLRPRPPVIASSCEIPEFAYVDPVELNRHPDTRRPAPTRAASPGM